MLRWCHRPPPPLRDAGQNVEQAQACRLAHRVGPMRPYWVSTVTEYLAIVRWGTYGAAASKDAMWPDHMFTMRRLLFVRATWPGRIVRYWSTWFSLQFSIVSRPIDLSPLFLGRMERPNVAPNTKLMGWSHWWPNWRLGHNYVPATPPLEATF